MPVRKSSVDGFIVGRRGIRFLSEQGEAAVNVIGGAGDECSLG